MMLGMARRAFEAANGMLSAALWPYLLSFNVGIRCYREHVNGALCGRLR